MIFGMICFVVIVCMTILCIYIILTKNHLGVKYILNEVHSDKVRRIKIKGNSLEICCNNKNIRIVLEDGDFYCEKDGEKDKIGFDEFEFENIRFRITQEEKRGNLIFLLPLSMIGITVILLFLQGYILMESEESNTVTEITQDTQMENNDSREENMISTGTSNEESTEDRVIIDDSLDIHSIVLNNKHLFQDEIVVNWNSCMFDENKRPYIDGICEFGFNASVYQGIIDWKKVKDDGISFAIINAGSRGYKEGKIYIDSNFMENIQGATENDIKVGVSFASQAISKEEVDEEVELIIELIGNYSLDYPIGISLNREPDHRASILTDEEYADILKYFCIKVKKQGYTPMLMAWNKTFVQMGEELDGCLKLVSNNKDNNQLVSKDDNIPIGINNCIIWQYEESRADMIDGISKGLPVSLYLSGYLKDD
ncbi:MAG: hypothetical protein NC225_03075 [Clostridium sp.]|nr:hypothetical protein [Clostridium sp.]MCM1398447.1 hypothetical protein [Clostridium sp.]MCM1458888.1 hypothetical protein [Bacteroides sp.]